jgi:hypothetical protein
MGKNQISQVFNPGNRVLESFGATQGWSANEQSTPVIVRGIVTAIKDVVDATGSEPVAPPYSIQAKIIGEDLSSISPSTESGMSWFAPLLPIHTISLPEIGEEVWIMREFQVKAAAGFWIGRVNDSTPLNKVLARSWSQAETPQTKYGFPFDVKNIAVPGPGSALPNYTIPLNPGDVVQQGRTNTFIRHTYNKVTGGGVLEFGIKEGRRYSINDASATLGNLQTKTIHAANTKLSEITSLPLPDSGKDAAIGPSEYYSTGQPVAEEKLNHIVSVAQRIVNITKGEGSGEVLSNAVLGNELNEFFTGLIGILKDSNDTVKSIAQILLAHTHIVNGFTQSDIIDVPTKGGTVTRTVTISVADQPTHTIAVGMENRELISSIADINREFDEITTKLDDHLSSNQLLN